MSDIFDERKQHMKKQYIYPRTSVSAIDGAGNIMGTAMVSNTVDLNIGDGKQDPGGALAPRRELF